MILYQTLGQIQTLVFLQYIQVTFQLRGESGESGTDEIGEAEWTQNLGGLPDNFTQESGPKLADGFDTAVATPIEYFELLFKPEIFFTEIPLASPQKISLTPHSD